MMKKLLIISIVLLTGVLVILKLNNYSKYWVTTYTSEGGEYRCSKRIKIKYVQAAGNSYKLETVQQPVSQGESDKYCKLYAAF